MVKKLLVGMTLLVFMAHAFAGYSSGGRSGYSGGSRSFSSSRSYSRPSTSYRSYSAPRSYYSNPSRTTVIHNTYHHHGGYGYGGGFWHGMLGGYLGATLANNHYPVAVGVPVGSGIGAAEGLPQGQGMLMERAEYVHDNNSIAGGMLFIVFLLIIIFIAILVKD